VRASETVQGEKLYLRSIKAKIALVLETCLLFAKLIRLVVRPRQADGKSREYQDYETQNHDRFKRHFRILRVRIS
jgi:hypothetical protein